MNQPGRSRLQKGDASFIQTALEAQGFRVHKTAKRVEGYDKVTGRYICGFYWRTATKAKDGQPAMPAGWRFDLSLSDAFSLKDLKSAITEAMRVRTLLPELSAAWVGFAHSKSDKRWSAYRGVVAALFMRQDPQDPDE